MNHTISKRILSNILCIRSIYVSIVPGSLTLEKEPKRMRSYSRRKTIAVPELLSVRAEMASQPKDEQNLQDMNEFLILNKPPAEDVEQSADNVKHETNEVETESMEILNSPTNNGGLSYISKNSVLVLTADGNYMIANLADNITLKSERTEAASGLEQIIILDNGELQFSGIEVCQEASQVTEEV